MSVENYKNLFGNKDDIIEGYYIPMLHSSPLHNYCVYCLNILLFALHL